MLDETFRHADVVKRRSSRGWGRFQPGRKDPMKYKVPNPRSTPKEIVGSHGHRPHGKSIYWPALYEHLRRKGYSKAKAAAISNAAWKKKRMGLPTNTPTSVRGLAKVQPDGRDLTTERPLGDRRKRRKRKAAKTVRRPTRVGDSTTSTIAKVDDDKRQVFGWAYVTHDPLGELNVDKSGEFVDDVDELEGAAYGFVLKARTGDTDHTNVVKSTMIESMVFTPDKMEAMGLRKGDLPIGWWTGWQVHDDQTWADIKSGKYTSFSIFGKATKKAID